MDYETKRPFSFGGYVILAFFIGSMLGIAILASNVRDLAQENEILRKDLKTSIEICPVLKEVL